MLDEKDLIEAVELQRKSYGLFRWWVETLVQKGTPLFDLAQHHESSARTAKEWLDYMVRSHLPPRYRPGSSDPAHLERYANIFSSYLLTSFELVTNPGYRVVTDGCNCEMCTHLVAAPNLRARKLTKRDKSRARLLMGDYIQALAGTLGRQLSEADRDAMLDEPGLAEDLALATYGWKLIERCRGDQEGPAILALWRAFAWTSTGSPKRGFRLTHEAILDAERRISARMTG